MALSSRRISRTGCTQAPIAPVRHRSVLPAAMQTPCNARPKQSSSAVGSWMSWTCRRCICGQEHSPCRHHASTLFRHPLQPACCDTDHIGTRAGAKAAGMVEQGEARQSTFRPPHEHVPRILHFCRPCPHSRIICSSQLSDNQQPQSPQDSSQDQLLYSVFMGGLWIAFVVYAFVFSPNQTPYRDQIFIKLLVGLREPGEDFVVNQVYTGIFNLLGCLPLMYTCLIVPGGRSANKVPAWPFLTGSFALGVMSLFPYFALWRPDRSQQLPPPKEELEGWNRVVMKGAETPVLPALILLGVLSQFYVIATASGASWAEMGKLLEESRLVHISTLDLMCLTAFAPFWMSNDAEGRKWDQRDTLIPILTCLPILGPAIYLLLRPKTDLSK